MLGHCLVTARSATVTTRNTVERAFELASSGRFGSLEAIRCQLLGEGYPSVHAHLRGLATRRQLKALCERSRRRSG